jgi:hypothetical protein
MGGLDVSSILVLYHKPGVMPGLDPGIQLIAKRMDCRVKPGNDERGVRAVR